MKSVKTEKAGMLPIIAAAKQTPGAISEVQRVQQINKKNPLSPLIYNPHL